MFVTRLCMRFPVTSKPAVKLLPSCLIACIPTLPETHVNSDAMRKTCQRSKILTNYGVCRLHGVLLYWFPVKRGVVMKERTFVKVLISRSDVHVKVCSPPPVHKSTRLFNVCAPSSKPSPMDGSYAATHSRSYSWIQPTKPKNIGHKIIP